MHIVKCTSSCCLYYIRRMVLASRYCSSISYSSITLRFLMSGCCAANTEDIYNRKCGYKADTLHRTSIKMKIATTVIISLLRSVERKIPKVTRAALYLFRTLSSCGSGNYSAFPLSGSQPRFKQLPFRLLSYDL